MAAALLYALCSSLLYRRLLARPASSLLDTRDPALFVWWIRWIPYAIGHMHNPFFTNWMNFPVGVNGLWNTTVPLLGVLAAPLTLTIGPVAATNLLFVLGPVVSAFAAFLVLRRYTRGEVSAVVGGLVYGFSPFFIGQGLGHLHLVWAVFPPLLLLFLDEIVVRQRWSPALIGSLLGLTCAVQILISPELLVLGFLVAAVAVIVMAAFWPSEIGKRAPYVLTATAFALGVTLVVAGWPLWTLAFGPNRPRGFLQLPGIHVADPISYVVPTKLQLLNWSVFRRIAVRYPTNISEETSYLGVTLLAFLTWFVVRKWRSGLVRVVALTAVVAAVFSLGPWPRFLGFRITDVPLPWRVLQATPLFKNALPARLSVFVGLAAALLVAMAVDEVKQLDTRPRLLGIAAIVVALLPLVPHAYKVRTLTPTPPLFAKAAGHIPSGSVLVIQPYPYEANVFPLLWQADAGMRFRLPGGALFGELTHANLYAGFEPEKTTLRDVSVALERGVVPVLTPELRSLLLAELSGLHARLIVVGPDRFERLELRFFETLLGRAPQPLAGTWVFRLDADR